MVIRVTLPCMDKMRHSTPISTAKRIASRFLDADHLENSYCNQLAWEALLLMADELDGIGERVARVIEHNGIVPGVVLSWRNQQFHDLAYPWFAHIGKLESWRDSHLVTTDAWISEAPRRPNGALVHDITNHPHLPDDAPVGSLLDMQQAYCIRLVRAARLSGEIRYIDECLLQYETHRGELRGDSGCYHQGKGWLPDDGRSPAPWSRGQGWYLHGLVHCLQLLDPWPQARNLVQSHTLELLDALLPLQGPSGLWHQLVDLPSESFPDSSGSALILEALLIYRKLFPTSRFDQAIDRAWDGLRQCVDDQGVVHMACKGPGTIWEEGPWRMTQAAPDDPHGVFSMLFACAAMA